MLGSFAEFERAMIRERTRAGLIMARREGRVGGRRPKLTERQRAEIIAMVSSGQKSESAYFHRFRPVVFMETDPPCSRKPDSRFHDFGHPFSPRAARVEGELGV
jgi:hypothetical protein